MIPTVGSLFAGIGGFDLGFEQAGFKTVWQCELDEHAQKVLRKRFPDAQLHSDVRSVGSHNLAPVDVVVYGSPCQDMSVSGKRAGLAGERSGLFFEAVRVIKELREKYGKPDFAIWENVPGAFSSNGGDDFRAVLQALADIGAVDICWRVLDAQYFGVAQRRRRIVLVASFGDVGADTVLFESQSGGGSATSSRQARQGAEPGTARRTGKSGWPVDVVDTFHAAFGKKLGLENQHVNGGCTWFVLDEGKIRRLVPEEFEALQGFPKGWTAGQADTHRYKQLGNAVAVPVAKWVAAKLLQNFY